MTIKPNGTLKIIALVLTGVAFLGSAFWTGSSALNDVKTHADNRIDALHMEQDKQNEIIRHDIASLKQDTAVIRTIIEERFGKKK